MRGRREGQELTRAVPWEVLSAVEGYRLTSLLFFFSHQGENGRYARCKLQADGAISAGIFYRGMAVPGKSPGVSLGQYEMRLRGKERKSWTVPFQLCERLYLLCKGPSSMPVSTTSLQHKHTILLSYLGSPHPSTGRAAPPRSVPSRYRTQHHIDRCTAVHVPAHLFPCRRPPWPCLLWYTSGEVLTLQIAIWFQPLTQKGNDIVLIGLRHEDWGAGSLACCRSLGKRANLRISFEHLHRGTHAFKQRLSRTYGP